MALIIIFNISGLALILLLINKKLEERYKKTLFISKLISKGDTHARRLYHLAVHSYSEGKERILFFINKQIPLHSRNSLNKTFSFLEDRRKQYLDNLRDSKLLKKSDGISEFFKNMSDLEKGNGEIHDDFDENYGDSQNR